MIDLRKQSGLTLKGKLLILSATVFFIVCLSYVLFIKDYAKVFHATPSPTPTESKCRYRYYIEQFNYSLDWVSDKEPEIKGTCIRLLSDNEKYVTLCGGVYRITDRGECGRLE